MKVELDDIRTQLEHSAKTRASRLLTYLLTYLNTYLLPLPLFYTVYSK